jgi:hypothetical protein
MQPSPLTPSQLSIKRSQAHPFGSQPAGRGNYGAMPALRGQGRRMADEERPAVVWCDGIVASLVDLPLDLPRVGGLRLGFFC